MKYYISDLHFGHKSIIKLDNRPFSNIDEMDRVLIENWNSRITKNNDHVYILGDIALHNEKPYSWYLSQLKGQKHLIIGNHDRKLLKDEEVLKYFVEIEHYLEVTDDEKRLVLSHYPIAEWNGFYSGSYHLYAHIHNNTNGVYDYMKTFDRALNAGCMINNYMPVPLRELIVNNQIFKENNK